MGVHPQVVRIASYAFATHNLVLTVRIWCYQALRRDTASSARSHTNLNRSG